jgi:[ribosomal protein S18]-alanine N-acetyltransferase
MTGSHILTDRSVKVALRSYRPADFETLYQIDQTCYSSDTAYSRADLRTYLGFFGADCVVAEIDAGSRVPAAEKVAQSAAKIAGFCISARRGDHGHIITMDVLEEFRRKGVGRLLLAEIEARLIAAGVRRVGLETAVDNETAIAFWQRHGYASVGIKKRYYPRGRDAYYMTKAIGPPSGQSNGPSKMSRDTGAKKPASCRRKR